MHADLPRFTGSVEHALDEKSRLIVPARFRERLGTGFVLTIGMADPCLALYPQAAWADFCDKLEAAPRKDDRYRKIVRHIFAHTEEVACDSQGRLLVPAALRAYAGIDREVVSVGSFTKVEVWAKERYAENGILQDQVGEFMAELGLY